MRLSQYQSVRLMDSEKIERTCVNGMYIHTNMEVSPTIENDLYD